MAVTFKLKKHDPFVIEGEHGKYEIPPLDSLEYDAWKDMATASKGDVKTQINACKAFFLGVCPPLANENIGDYNWMIIGKKYLEIMGE